MKIVSNGKTLEVPSGVSQDIYSLKEQVAGRWIDGRPVYKKTLVTQTAVGVNHLPLNEIDLLIDASGSYIYGRYTVPIQIYTGPQYGAEEFLAVYTEDGTLTYRAGSSAGSRTVYITVLYTKTTDQATIELPAGLSTPTAAVVAGASHTEEVGI